MHPKYKFHPIADLFPLMDESELAELAEDLKANGLRVPIVLYQKKILDGRNRYLACAKAEVKSSFWHYKGNEPIQFCLSLNLRRRHLTLSQRAAVAADLANLGNGQRADYAAASNEAPVSQPEAAERLDVSRSAVQRAVAIRTADPEIHGKVKAGEISLADATRALALKGANGIEGSHKPEPTEPPVDDSSHGTSVNGAFTALTDEEQIIRHFKRYVKEVSEDFHKTTSEIRSYIKTYLNRTN
jgi:hypothetical protein